MPSPHDRRALPLTALAACALLAALALALASAAAAGALPSRSLYRAQRLCGQPRPGYATCLGMRLVAKSLTPAALHASALRQAREASGGATPAVTVKASPLGAHAAGVALGLLAPRRKRGELAADDRGRRRARRSDSGSRSRRLRQAVRPRRVHDRERLLPQAQPGRAPEPSADAAGRMGDGDLARRADGTRGLPDVSPAACRGKQRILRRPRRGSRTRPLPPGRPRSATPTVAPRARALRRSTPPTNTPASS